MRIYSVNNVDAESTNWQELHGQVFSAFQEREPYEVSGEHESLEISYGLLVGRIVLKNVYTAQLPRIGVEFSGTATGSFLTHPTFYVCRYAEGDQALRLEIHDETE